MWVFYYISTPHIHINNICNQNTDISNWEFYNQTTRVVVIEASSVFVTTELQQIETSHSIIQEAYIQR